MNDDDRATIELNTRVMLNMVEVAYEHAARALEHSKETLVQEIKDQVEAEVSGDAEVNRRLNDPAHRGFLSAALGLAIGSDPGWEEWLAIWGDSVSGWSGAVEHIDALAAALHEIWARENVNWMSTHDLYECMDELGSMFIDHHPGNESERDLWAREALDASKISG